MNYYLWELNESRKEIIFNKSEEKMSDMEALNIDQFNEIVNRHPEYQLIDLEAQLLNAFKHTSQKHPEGDAGLVNMLMRGFNA